MDSFAAYKTNSSVIESVIDEAKECCNAADMRNDVYENHGQVRCTRELLFASEESELRTCLNIVAANETDKFQFVKDTVSELFIRANKPIQMEYLDVKKQISALTISGNVPALRSKMRESTSPDLMKKSRAASGTALWQR